MRWGLTSTNPGDQGFARHWRLAAQRLANWASGEDRRSIARYWQHATRQTGSVKFKSWLIPSCQKSRSKLESYLFFISLINVNFLLKLLGLCGCAEFPKVKIRMYGFMYSLLFCLYRQQMVWNMFSFLFVLHT